ncbi:hypothetical protein [Streptomyces sp. NPDC000878]
MKEAPRPANETLENSQASTPEWDIPIDGLQRAFRPTLLGYPIDPAYPAQVGDPGKVHVTVEMVADAPTAEISQAGQQVLIDA